MTSRNFSAAIRFKSSVDRKVCAFKVSNVRAISPSRGIFGGSHTCDLPKTHTFKVIADFNLTATLKKREVVYE